MVICPHLLCFYFFIFYFITLKCDRSLVEVLYSTVDRTGYMSVWDTGKELIIHKSNTVEHMG